MCFTAGGSFVAGGGLTLIGTKTLEIANKEERMIAAVPLMFAIQQTIEGVQWLAPHPSIISIILGYAYLFFAFLLWPSYLPFATYYIEHDLKKRRDLRWFMGIGFLTSAVLLVILIIRPLEIIPHPYGIEYKVDMPFGWMGLLVYAAAACGSLLISSRKALQIFGLACILSGILAGMIFQQTFYSVWCFFSAALCGFVYLIVRYGERKKKAAK